MKFPQKYSKHTANSYVWFQKNKTRLATVVKSALFLFILGILTLCVQNILAVPETGTNEKTGINDIHKYPNSYDVCIIGRSTAIANISFQELYEQYGIAGVSAGVSSQSFPMTLYTLEEVLEYQSPQVVILDTRALFESVQIETRTFQDEAYIHYTLDDIKTLSIKKRALEKIQEHNKEIDTWDYFSKFYYSHVNWKTISEKNFTLYDSKNTAGMHGNIAYLNIADSVSNTYSPSSPYSIATISRQMEQYITDAVELCRQHGTDLLLATNYVQSSKPHHNALVRLARKHGIKYIDINDYLLKSGFNYDLDLNDAVHFNLSGAIKMTHLLGDYLENNYTFTDKRKEPSYKRFEEKRELFHMQKDFISLKQTLLSSTSFYKYLTALNELDLSKNIIFITVYGDSLKNITAIESELLLKLGLQINLIGKSGGSYVAIITEEGANERFSFVDTASLEGEIGTLSYEITSSGKTDQQSDIRINEKSSMYIGKGINFVIYNIEFDQIAHTCFFDTTSSINPDQSRYKTSNSTQLQHAVAPNVWETAE